MNCLVVRYTTRPEARAENESRIRAVFEALRRTAPPDVRYFVLANEAGEFLHLSGGGGGSPSLTGLPEFAAFQQGHADRRAGELSRETFTVIGEYRPADGG